MRLLIKILSIITIICSLVALVNGILIIIYFSFDSYYYDKIAQFCLLLEAALITGIVVLLGLLMPLWMMNQINNRN
ncbi:hypothetical protein RHO14_03340 [Orbus wheelerorum]|uniref:hypothetical protein n=1 Tax=Orbus wheelerorum TaxID=3074111 RepID=UPI00370D4B1E